MNNPDYYLLANVVRAAGGVPKPLDSIRDLYFKWREARLGRPPADDRIYEFLWDLAEAEATEPPKVSDSKIDLLRKLAGRGTGTTVNESLRAILEGYSSGSITVDATDIFCDSTLITVDHT